MDRVRVGHRGVTWFRRFLAVRRRGLSTQGPRVRTAEIVAPCYHLDQQDIGTVLDERFPAVSERPALGNASGTVLLSITLLELLQQRREDVEGATTYRP